MTPSASASLHCFPWARLISWNQSSSQEGQAAELTTHGYLPIALHVIDLREKHGLTQAQLAERCGIDQGDISRIERGSTSPTARTLQRIAEALDADVRLVARAS